MATTVSLIVLLPLAGFALLVLFGRRLGEPWAGWLATVAVAGSFIAAVAAFFQLRGIDERTFEHTYFSWIPAGSFHVNADVLLDPLSMTMVLFITGIGTLIHLYSIAYMHGDERFPKFFLYLNLFIFSMLALVLGGNLAAHVPRAGRASAPARTSSSRSGSPRRPTPRRARRRSSRTGWATGASWSGCSWPS